MWKYWIPLIGWFFILYDKFETDNAGFVLGNTLYQIIMISGIEFGILYLFQ